MEEGIHAFTIMEVRSGELGSWSDTKGHGRREIPNATEVRGTDGRDDGDAVGIKRGALSEDEDLGFGGSELEA